MLLDKSKFINIVYTYGKELTKSNLINFDFIVLEGFRLVPNLFLAHGSPMLAIQENEYTEVLKRVGTNSKPKAIVIFTAHWESEILTISYTDSVYETIYDYYGFPDIMYTLKYPARGSKEIAERVRDKFIERGIPAKFNTQRGLDHGSWVVLSKMYPKADIPVVQISVNPFLPPSEQIRIGESLRGLGNEGIMVIGSGVTVHNLRILKWGQEQPEAWATEFDDWIIEKVQNKDVHSLSMYESLAPHAGIAVPRPEHFVPLLIAFGSADPAATVKVLNRTYEAGTLSYLSFRFD
jgi:4,5-DOPA dioxygenase extradiol